MADFFLKTGFAEAGWRWRQLLKGDLAGSRQKKSSAQDGWRASPARSRMMPATLRHGMAKRKRNEMLYLYILLTVIAGIAVTVQVGVNNALRQSINSPFVAAFFSFAVGTMGLLIYALATRTSWPSMQTIAKVPTWAWFGGVLGAFYVVTAIIAAPKLGAASLIGILVTTQLCTSLFLDHFGLIGFAQHSINMWRATGALLLIAGVMLIVKN